MSAFPAEALPLSIEVQSNAPEQMARRGPNWFVTSVFVLTVFLLYLPLFALIAQAFLDNPYDWASGFTTRWLLKLFHDGAIWEPLVNSLSIGILSATLATFLGTLGAVGLSQQGQLPASLRMLILLPILIPEIITGLSLLLFFLFFRLPLGFFTVVLAHASFSASFVYFIMAEQLKKLDPQLFDAAQDLGAEPRTIFWKVTVPNILPGLMGGWLLAFTISFDDFLISFFTSGAGLTTLPLRIYSLMRIGVSPELNGLSLILILISTFLVCVLLARESSRKWVLKG